MLFSSLMKFLHVLLVFRLKFACLIILIKSIVQPYFVSNHVLFLHGLILMSCVELTSKIATHQISESLRP